MIAEVISSEIDIPGVMEFTAATPGPISVAVTGPGEGVYFRNGADRNGFEPGDNMILKAAWISIPYGFGAADGQVRFSPQWFAAGPQVITELGGDSGTQAWVTIPNPCKGLEYPDMGVFLRVPTSASASQFSMNLVEFEMNVSMVNLPDVLNAQVIKVQLHLMIVHTKPMIFLS